MSELQARLVTVARLTDAERAAMFALMRENFSGMRRESFDVDLAGKRWVIMLEDGGCLCGFTTMCEMRATLAGERVRAIFSGDTIITRAHWGTLALERAWGRFVFGRVARDPRCRWYWFLICKGYRTYRYLPVYFKRYFPGPDMSATPFEHAVLTHFAGRRYGTNYDAATQIIRLPGNYCLREGVGDISERELRNPAIAFFNEINPQWRRGDELACLAELTMDNLRPLGRRLAGSR